ncbi:MAG: phytanoyl-CoA dioxygenase family protein [Acidimicrobiales bacterium]
MSYPRASVEQISAFREHGWIVVADTIDPDDLSALEANCAVILDKKDKMAFDWAWEAGKSRDERDFHIVQSSPSMFWPELRDGRVQRWVVEFGSALLGRDVEFWYDQFLAKPPRHGARTLWHQDEGYWGRNLDDKGITCWIPFHDVDEQNGCMHFVDAGHSGGVLEHKRPESVQSDLLYCEPDESRAVACPIRLGSVTFHHSKTPHMTTPNASDDWRRICTIHMQAVGCGGEGDHYPWKVYVNQATGETTVPERR